MTIPTGYKANFDTLLAAAGANDLALVECHDTATGRPVYTVCAVHTECGEIVITPIAKLFDGNPYEELTGPDYDPRSAH